MLRYRLVSGAAMVAGLCILTFWDSRHTAWIMIALACLICIGGLREFFRISGNVGAAGFPIVAAVSGATLITGTGLQGIAPFRPMIAQFPTIQVAMGLLALLGFIRVFQCADYAKGLARLGATAAGVLYVVVPMACLLQIYLFHFPALDGRAALLFLVLTTKLGDIGGYTLGRISNGLMSGGNHKMVPRLSPGKSWEGFVGSLLFSGVGAWLLNQYLGDWAGIEGGQLFSTTLAVTTGVLLGAFGLVGDLAESVLKRAGGLKDSGGAIPGMGGVLDVIDSLLLVTPAFWMLLKISEV